MSFYLLPPVSYQTQQKLKTRMKDKQDNHKHRKRSVASSASTTGSLRTSSTRRSTNSVASSEDSSKSSMSYETPESSIKETDSLLQPKREYSVGASDTLSNLDEISMSDTVSFSNESIFSTRVDNTYRGGEKVSEKKDDGKKKKGSVYNYSYNSEINEVLKFNKEYAQQRRRSSSKRSQSIHSGNSTDVLDLSHSLSNMSIDENSVKITFKDVNFQGGPSISEEDKSEEDDLEPVYSDVDSIFSTRFSESPSKSKTKSKSKSKSKSSVFSSVSTKNSEVEILSNVPQESSNLLTRKFKKKLI